jgi:hypothetical protein
VDLHKISCKINAYLAIWHVGRDTVVGIATRCGPDGPGIASPLGRDFLHLSRAALGPIHPPIKWIPGFFPGNNAAGAWRYQLHLAPRLKKVELYLDSLSAPLWPDLARNLPLSFMRYGILVSRIYLTVTVLRLVILSHRSVYH